MKQREINMILSNASDTSDDGESIVNLRVIDVGKLTAQTVVSARLDGVFRSPTPPPWRALRCKREQSEPPNAKGGVAKQTVRGEKRGAAHVFDWHAGDQASSVLVRACCMQTATRTWHSP